MLIFHRLDFFVLLYQDKSTNIKVMECYKVDLKKGYRNRVQLFQFTSTGLEIDLFL